MLSNVGVMHLIFTLSVMQVTLICLATGRDPSGVKIAVVNGEMNWETKDCPIPERRRLQQISCRYLNYLDNATITQEQYKTKDEALEAMKDGRVWGVLHVTENFTDAFVARLILGSDADEETIDQSSIDVWLDKSNKTIERMITKDLEDSYKNFEKVYREMWDFDSVKIIRYHNLNNVNKS